MSEVVKSQSRPSLESNRQPELKVRPVTAASLSAFVVLADGGAFKKEIGARPIARPIITRMDGWMDGPELRLRRRRRRKESSFIRGAPQGAPESSNRTLAAKGGQEHFSLLRSALLRRDKGITIEAPIFDLSNFVGFIF